MVKYLLFFLMCGATFGQVQFNYGSSNFVNFGSGAEYDLSNGTVMAWIEIDTLNTYNTIISKESSGINLGDGTLIVQSGKANLQIQSASVNYTIKSDDVLLPGELYHVAGKFGTNGMHLYINGVLQTETNAYTGGWTKVDNNLLIAHNIIGSTLYLDGTITDARVYNRALSAQEISEIYHNPWALADDPALVLHTCITTNDTGTALTGVARNYGTGADGTYSNAPTVAVGKIQTSKPLTMEIP